MKIYANLDELVPHLDEIDDWLYVDEDRWAKNPAAAEIYLFAEEEAEYCDTHDGEDFDNARPPYIPAQLVDRPIGILLESGTLYDVLWNLAKYVPDYTTEQLAHAVSFYSELNLNQYSVGSPCRTICTVCGSPPCPDLNLIHYIKRTTHSTKPAV